ncbi:MAG: hypothetical protein MR298_09860 [Odoribacter sp.]|nr:hypothetical protein [Odoribacter sp.]MDY3032465.1 hypothetical protein [Odoribacter sp.]
MKKIYLLIAAIALIMSACNSNKVKVRGDVKDLVGTVKLLAEMPGQQGMVVLAQQEVTDGKIDLETEQLQIPARVWIDIAGKNTLTTIIDSKDQIWIQGKAKFADQIEVKGSGLDKEYNKLKKMFAEKYEGPIEPIDKNIQKLMNKEKRNANDEVMLGVFQLQRQRYIRARANYVKNLIEANPTQELSLFLLQDELQDSTDLQKRLFKLINVPNKESNLYKTVAEKMQ